MAEETTITPHVDSFTFKSSMLGSPTDIYSRISALALYDIKILDNSVKVAKVESFDIQKRPFLFYIISLNPDSVNVEYTLLPDSSPKLRLLSVLSNFIFILSQITDLYSVDSKELFQNISAVTESILNSISQNYSTLFNKYDSMLNDFKELKRRSLQLESENKEFSFKINALEEENQSLKKKLASLEVYSDNALMVMVEEWLDAHDGAIDIEEFSNLHNISMTRTEQILNKMVSEGYISLVG
ncbi:MAG: hypothetical protein ACP5RP_00985 [Candidatus Micrarchaeia archaeon]